MSDHFSAGSEDSTSDSTGPDTDTYSSASPTPTGGTCSVPGGPELTSDPTCDRSPSVTSLGLSENQRGELLLTEQAHQLTRGGGKPGQGYPAVLTFSSEDSPARISPSPGSEPDSQAPAQACSSSSPESQTLFDPAGYSSRTYPVSSLAKAVGTSESCLERWPTSGTAWRGGFSTHVSSECRSADGECSSSEPSLTEILEPPQNVPAKYSLSARAASGILRRAEKRGRTLPPHLEEALARVAGTTAIPSTGGGHSSLSGMGSGGPDDNDAQAGRLVSYPISGDALRAGDAKTPSPEIGVRRLTPTECERLQSFPDGWTQLGDTADSKRYSALGDAVTVNVSAWIGSRFPV